MFALALTLISWLTAVENNNKAQDNCAVQQFEKDTIKYAIINSDAARNRHFKNSKVADLDRVEIRLLFELLNEAVAEYNKKDTLNRIGPLENYKFQFVAVVNEKNEKETWVNSFCSEHDLWRKVIIGVKDGGSCYFNLKINLSQRKFYQMMVNGEA